MKSSENWEELSPFSMILKNILFFGTHVSYSFRGWEGARIFIRLKGCLQNSTIRKEETANHVFSQTMVEKGRYLQ